jgi:hypothetical protein
LPARAPIEEKFAYTMALREVSDNCHHDREHYVKLKRKNIAPYRRRARVNTMALG